MRTHASAPPQSLEAYRAAVRDGRWRGPTRGAVPGRVQCNLVVLPVGWAGPFGEWCAANAEVAPVLARSAPGSPLLAALGAGVDVRTDVPAYRVFRHGTAAEDVHDLTELWRVDLVAFAFGCSFSLEDALRAGGVELRYEARGFGGAIYRCATATKAVGPFAGPLIVSMRPIPADQVDLAIDVSRRHPALHGAPVHVGDPSALGIDVDDPMESFGAVSVAPGEVPVFWACGVTTQAVLEAARPPLAITHRSAHMLVTELSLADVAASPPGRAGDLAEAETSVYSRHS